MKLSEITNAIRADVLCAAPRLTEIEVDYAFASDLMSDVLAFCFPGSLLLTGLTNIQIIRTAQMLDIPAIIFVRAKYPKEETIRLASENGIPLLVSPFSMYETCGLLHDLGLDPCPISQDRKA